MDSGAPNLDGDDRVQSAYGGLKGFEVRVLVGEDAEHPSIDAEADTCVDVLLRRLEPSVTLGLRQVSVWRWRRNTGECSHLLEDVMEQSIVGVVVHVDDGTRAERVGAATHTRTRGGDEQAGLDG